MSDTSGGTPTHALALEPGEELRDVVVCINDCVYGMIEPPAYCAAVIETPLFQRLGRVKQLGNLAHVWPSATHSRLEHSLGTMHLAREYAARLCLRPAEEQALVLASLLHDIGHGPFSHIFETALAGTPSGDAFRHHDAYRVRLIQEDPPLRDALGPRMVAAVLAVWEDSWSEGLPFDAAMCGILHALLAGVAGVDRMDYIIRDLYHTTPHRRLDRTCIQSIMMQTVIDREAGVVLHSQKAERFIQSLLEERRYLFRTVYQHRRCRVVDGLMQQAFRAGVAAAVAPLLRTASDFEQLDDAFIVQLAWDPALPQAARELLLQVSRCTPYPPAYGARRACPAGAARQHAAGRPSCPQLQQRHAPRRHASRPVWQPNSAHPLLPAGSGGSRGSGCAGSGGSRGSGCAGSRGSGCAV